MSCYTSPLKAVAVTTPGILYAIIEGIYAIIEGIHAIIEVENTSAVYGVVHCTSG